MTLVRKAYQQEAAFNTFFNDYFKSTEPTSRVASVRVNVAESKDDYKIELVAPGFDKKDIKLEIDQGVLKVSANPEVEEKPEYLRNEFKRSSFERAFELPDHVNAKKIEAKYESGILRVVLPKNEQKKLSKLVDIL